MKRIDNRNPEDCRPISAQRNFTRYAPGSVLICVGETKVLCTVNIEESVPPFLKNSGTGWLTAEYSLLPGATHTRFRRELSKGHPSGRTSEIQRLIGRALRSIIDFSALGERTLYVDADVLQADGGTRTTAITGSMLALYDAINELMSKKTLKTNPIKECLAAVSVGILNSVPICDLNYEEDSQAEVDMNIVMTESGRFIEIQGTAEREPFNRDQLNQLLDLSHNAIQQQIQFIKTQAGLLAPIAS